MADEQLSFSITDTLDFGMGDAQVLQDLYAPETTTTDPKDVNLIEKKEAPITTAPKEGDTAKVQEEGSILKDFINDNEGEEEVEETQETEEEDTTEEKVNQFEALSKDLAKLGVFELEEDEELDIKTPEAFLERFNEEKKRGSIQIVNNFIGQFGEDYQQAFDAIFVKGVDPKEYFQSFIAVENYSNMDLTVESNQEAIIKQSLIDQGFDQEDISTEIQRIKDYGDLEKTAEKHHKVLVKKEAHKLSEITKQKEEQIAKEVAYKKQYQQNVSTVLQEKLKAKEFDGIPITPKLASEVNDYLVTDKYQTPTGEKLTEFDKEILDLKRPENHATKVKVALLLKILKEDPSLSSLGKKAITKQTNELFSEVVRQKDKTVVTKPKKAVTPPQWMNL